MEWSNIFSTLTAFVQMQTRDSKRGGQSAELRGAFKILEAPFEYIFFSFVHYSAAGVSCDAADNLMCAFLERQNSKKKKMLKLAQRKRGWLVVILCCFRNAAHVGNFQESPTLNAN